MSRITAFILCLKTFIASPVFGQEVLFDFESKSQLDEIRAKGLQMSIVNAGSLLVCRVNLLAAENSLRRVLSC
jgi:hypothetical protein